MRSCSVSDNLSRKIFSLSPLMPTLNYFKQHTSALSSLRFTSPQRIENPILKIVLRI